MSWVIRVLRSLTLCLASVRVFILVRGAIHHSLRLIWRNDACMCFKFCFILGRTTTVPSVENSSSPCQKQTSQVKYGELCCYFFLTLRALFIRNLFLQAKWLTGVTTGVGARPPKTPKKMAEGLVHSRWQCAWAHCFVSAANFWLLKARMWYPTLLRVWSGTLWFYF